MRFRILMERRDGLWAAKLRGPDWDVEANAMTRRRSLYDLEKAAFVRLSAVFGTGVGGQDDAIGMIDELEGLFQGHFVTAIREDLLIDPEPGMIPWEDFRRDLEGKRREKRR